MSVNILYGEYIYVKTFSVIVLGNSSNRNEVKSSVRNDRRKTKTHPPDITQAIHSLCRVMIHLYKNFTAEIGAYQEEVLKVSSIASSELDRGAGQASHFKCLSFKPKKCLLYSLDRKRGGYQPVWTQRDRNSTPAGTQAHVPYI